jgi:hypothetical protein
MQMIDAERETLLSLIEAVKALPIKGGHRPHASTIWRWARKGVRGKKLEYVRVGNQIYTSIAAITRFINELAAADNTPQVQVDAVKHFDTQSPQSTPESRDRARRALERGRI